MTREELLKLLWETAELLDDKQLEKATASLEAIACPERAPPPNLADDKIVNPMSHGEFVTELSSKLRTSEEKT